MHLFRLDASVRTSGSVSRALADTAEQAWLGEHPGATVTRRDIGLEPLPSELWAKAARSAVDPSAPAAPEAAELTRQLSAELLEADAYVFAVPLYNWGVPAHFKTWIDLVLLNQDFGGGGSKPLAGRPAVLAMSRGGGYGEGTPKFGWDHNSPYIVRVLADVLHLDVHVAEAELTLADVTPAMEPLRGLAAQLLQDGHATAAGHGRRVAELVRVSVG
ncbi:NAD(P)H-dependent oxidoreductase [Dactylosporangium vinaceum]|uniref:FMN-dependent NADH-azoreductase n=1 Tax=Dactylosporangium vinaceum TaxID=53362 RepID=A0ABV5MFW7_9ACTN|nr:NAD(P)H-dependent oxidoreductase [Dactylosporangium vinaceum]UAB98900.1 NAD(P)H-dependent oxidoreductase [Dactylosporangium vinaceum]